MFLGPPASSTSQIWWKFKYETSREVIAHVYVVIADADCTTRSGMTSHVLAMLSSAHSPRYTNRGRTVPCRAVPTTAISTIVGGDLLES